MSDLIPNRGRSYEELLTYKKAATIYNVTALFATTYIERGDRTLDQMVQAARSGKQNIVEGCANSGTSSDMEMKLLGVARGSLAELREDYKDFLSVRGAAQWSMDSEEYKAMRKLCSEQNSYEEIRPYFDRRMDQPLLICNMMIVLIDQVEWLLSRQIEAAEKKFLTEGGFRERSSQARRKQRGW